MKLETIMARVDKNTVRLPIGMQCGLQKQQEEQVVPCGRGHCVSVTKVTINFALAITYPIGVEAFECRIYINLVLPYRAVAFGTKLG